MTEKELKFTEMSLGAHLQELRLRVILSLLGLAVCLIICLFFSRPFLALLAKPYSYAMQQIGMENKLQAITLSEKFLVYMKTALLFGLILSSPWVFYQLWKFVSAGLYSHEKKFVYIISPLCAALFIAGAMFFLLAVAPIIIRFFVGFDSGIDFVQTQVTLASYINFMFSMMLIFGLCFQMPIAIVAVNKIGLVSIENLKKARKYVLLAIFIVAAFATPPDVISQITLAIPMYLLFELGVLFCR